MPVNSRYRWSSEATAKHFHTVVPFWATLWPEPIFSHPARQEISSCVNKKPVASRAACTRVCACAHVGLEGDPYDPHLTDPRDGGSSGGRPKVIREPAVWEWLKPHHRKRVDGHVPGLGPRVLCRPSSRPETAEAGLWRRQGG